MSDQDDNQNFVLAVLAGVVALVIALVLGVAIWSTQQDTRGAEQAGLYESLPMLNIYFEVGSAALPPDAGEALTQMTELARGYAEAVVRISGFHDASGDAAKNAVLAKQRAEAVQAALMGFGLPKSRVKLVKPAQTAGGADERDARRVEIRLE